MKNFRTLLLLVCSLASVWASAQGVQSFTVVPATGYQGTPYEVRFTRNVSTYPLTPNGLTAVKAALVSGTFNLTVVSSGTMAGSTYTANKYYSGCVIASGTRPGVSPPTCTTHSAGGLPILAANSGLLSKYSYSADNGGTLQIRASGASSANVKIETQSGQTLTLSNAQNPTIPYNTYVGYGPSGDTNYPYDWTFRGVPQVPIRVSLKTTGSADVAAFTPIVGTNLALTGPTGTIVTPPVTTTTTPPITSTQPVGTFAAGYGEGSVSDLMQFAPFVPSPQTDQLASWNIAANPQQFINNGTVKFGIHGIIGGSGTHISVNGGKNWANTNGDGFAGTYVWNGQTITGIADPGRSGFTWSMYGWPRSNYAKTGHGSTSEYYDTGLNPVPGGSVYRDYSGVQAFEKRILSNGQMAMYSKTNPYIWALHGYRSNVNIHNWFTYGSDPHVIRAFSIIENGSDDAAAREYLGAEQEGPFAFLTADLHYQWIWQGTGPVTVAGLRDISSAQPTEDANPNTNATFAGAFQGTRAFIGATDANGNGVWLIPKYNNRFNVRRLQANAGDSTSNATSYIQSAMMFPFDVKGNHAFEYQVYVGNKQGFVDWYNTENPTTTPFSWSFAAGKTAGWWSSDTPFKFNSENRYEFTFGRSDGSGGNFCPPYGVYNATEIPTIYLKGRFYNISQIDIRWNRFDQDDNASNGANQVTTVNVNGDGSEQTIAVPMAGKTGWSSVISSMRFAPHLGNTATTSQKFVPTYIGKNNPATNDLGDLSTLILLSLAAGGLRRKKALAVRGPISRKPILARKTNSLV